MASSKLLLIGCQYCIITADNKKSKGYKTFNLEEDNLNHVNNIIISNDADKGDNKL